MALIMNTRAAGAPTKLHDLRHQGYVSPETRISHFRPHQTFKGQHYSTETTPSTHSTLLFPFWTFNRDLWMAQQTVYR
ncbi:hypothetical protein AMECASPLE_034489 [Ameca splendens]|uniref:Uncharacterized protein n=1 Tax=Ameca splendens TaxID=208324 RepID=A0ABV0Z5E5_9TELE